MAYASCGAEKDEKKKRIYKINENSISIFKRIFNVIIVILLTLFHRSKTSISKKKRKL